MRLTGQATLSLVEDVADAHVRVDDVEALPDALLGRGADLLHGPADQEHGRRELRAREPDGHVPGTGRS